MVMAATLCFLQLPLLPKQHHYHHRHSPSSSSSSSSTYLRFTTTTSRLLHDSHHNNTRADTPPPPPPSLNPSLITETTTFRSTALPLIPLALPFFLDPKDAVAVGGEFGLLEGRTLSLVHPLVMAGLFLYTLYAGYLGWQWRRVRTLQTQINDLKKQQLPAVPVAASQTPPPPQPSLSPVELQIQQLTEERKQLIKGQYRDKHFDAGSLLLGFGVFESVFGALNTWFRTGKLFPGPHLFAGAGITVLWAAAAALVPAMQKGNETARNLHIALNALNVILFIWQIPTGIDIVFKVLEFTKWP